MKKNKLRLLLLPLVAILLSSCGDGPGSDSYTVRPKTLDGISLNIAGDVTLTFTRTSAGSAISVGDVESGQINYEYANTRKLYPTVGGSFIEAMWPVQVSNPNYTYTPINNDSGVITVTGNGVAILIEDDISGFPLHIFFGPGVTQTFSIYVTFANNGTSISSSVVRVEDNDTAVTTDADFVGFQVDATFRANATFSANGAAIPLNYSNNVDLIVNNAPETISQNSFVFNDATGTIRQFSLELVATQPGVGEGSTEIGTTIYFNAFNAVLFGAAGYEYSQTSGTSDQAQIVLDGGTPQDGTITLTFTSIVGDNQEGGGTYVTSTGLTGTFTYSNAPSDLL